jgi:hypothetical protein
MLVQKLSHNRNEALPPHARRPVYKRPLFWMSLLLMIIVPAPLDIIAFGLTPQSLLAPLSSVTLVLNTIFAPCLLGETLTALDVAATLLIVSGACISTVFGSHSHRIYDVAGLETLYTSAPFIKFETLMFAAGAAALAYVWLGRRNSNAEAAAAADAATAIAAVNDDKVSSDKDAASSLLPMPSSSSAARRGSDSGGGDAPPSDPPLSAATLAYNRRVPFAYGFLAAVCGVQQNLFTKTFSELLLSSISPSASSPSSAAAASTGVSSNQMHYALTYVVLLVSITFAVLQIAFINTGLAHADALLFLPIYNAFLIVAGIYAGRVYFAEMHALPTRLVICFVFGVCCTLSGIALLAQKKTPPPSPPRSSINKAEGSLSFLSDDDVVVDEEASLLMSTSQRDAASVESPERQQLLSAFDHS